jgi:hypothetical protein
MADLGEELARLRAALEEAQVAIADRETALAGRDREVDSLRQRLADSAARYRRALIAADPDVPEDLVAHSDLPDEIEASLEAARATVAKIKDKLAQEQRGEGVPLGAPIRAAVDLSSLTPKEKIAYGLHQR